MVDIKEIKNVKLAPFALMYASIQALIAFIIMIIMVLGIGLVASFIPALEPLTALITGLGIALVIGFPILVFLIDISTGFLTAMFYNLLAPRVGGIKLGMEGNEIKSIPVIPFALITACVYVVWAFVIGVLMAALLAPLTGALGSTTALISMLGNNTTTAIPGLGEGIAIFAALGAIFLIIVMPIIAFISGFIGSALIALFYNFFIPKVGGIKLELAQVKGSLTEITSIPVIPAALAAAVVFAVLGFIYGLLNLIGLSMNGDPVGGLISLVGTTIMYFIQYFILVALITIFYNFLRPRIGGVKLDIE